MREYRREAQEIDERPRPSGSWRKKYKCPKTKGDHEFELIKPTYLSNIPEIRNKTVIGYYLAECEKYMRETKDGKIRSWRAWRSVLYHWRCVHCGKLEMDTFKNPNKKIREHLKKPDNANFFIPEPIED